MERVHVLQKEEKPLGLIDLVSLGVGGTIGSGIFVVPAVSVGIAGPSSLLAWLLCSVSFGAVLTCLIVLSRRYAITGAFYTLFIRTYDGRLSAFIIVSYILSGIIGISTIAAAIGDNVSIPGVSKPILELSIVILFGAVNLFGIALAAWVEDILTVIKILPLLVIPLVLLPFVSINNFIPFSPNGDYTFLKSAVVVYWCYTGFELSAIPSRSVKDPERTVPLSLLYVFVTVTVVYLSLNFALIGSIGSAALASTPAPISYAMDRFFNGSGVVVLAIALVSMLSALNAYLIGTSIVIQDFAGKNAGLSKETRSGAPVYAILLCTVLSAFLLLFSNYFVFLASASVFATLIPYLFLCWAAFRSDDKPWVKVVAFAGIISTMAVLLSTFMI